jgi:hypothetical protein
VVAQVTAEMEITVAEAAFRQGLTEGLSNQLVGLLVARTTV